jgi:hypothetical protein
MLEPSRHERNGHPSVVCRHFLMPSFANFKAGHGFSDEIGETSPVTKVSLSYAKSKNKTVQNCSHQEIFKACPHARAL